MAAKGIAVVTGGAGGIGQTVLGRLAADGFDTVSWDLSDQAPAAARALAVDLTDPAASEQAAARSAQDGPIRALVVNAGILGPVAPVWDLPPDQVRRVLEVNLFSAFMTLRAVIPHMLEAADPARGRIVVMASLQAKEGTALAGPYAASKAGLIALTKVVSKELAPHGILINAVTPTVVRTAMESSITPQRRADLLSRIPLGRFLEPEEVAAMVSWLCSAECSASTGAVFDLSGGRATS